MTDTPVTLEEINEAAALIGLRPKPLVHYCIDCGDEWECRGGCDGERGQVCSLCSLEVECARCEGFHEPGVRCVTDAAEDGYTRARRL
jgi:hypothetical protein